MSEIWEDERHIRARAKAVADWLVRNQQHLDGQLTSSSAWLSASLLALNSGGAIALSQVVDRVENPRLTLALLVTGIVFALLSPVIIQSYAARVSPIIGERVIYWAGVAEGEQVDEAVDDGFVAQFGKWKWMSVASPACGWISALLFVLAVLTVAYGFDADATANDKRCEAIQHDMLSAIPRRSDSLKLFEVLGCKPVGSEAVQIKRDAQ